MRRFTFSEGSSNKFWEAETKGKDLLIRFGKLGSAGQLKLKTLASPAAAVVEMDKVIAEKVKKGYVEDGGQKKAAPAKQKSSSGVKATDLVFKEVSVAGNSSPRNTTLIDDEVGHVVIGAGNGMYSSSDGKHFYRHVETPHESWDLFTLDNVVYSTGTDFAFSKDVGQSWKRVKLPTSDNFYVLLRDSKGTYWMGSDDGIVLTSDHPQRGWKKAKFKAPGKVLSMAEIDGKLFIVGVGCITWDGKKTAPLKGTTKRETICRITEAPNGGVVLLGNDGVSYHSSDRGKSFKKTKSGYKAGDDLEDSAWVTGALFVVGGGWSSPLVLRSDDEGKTFKKVKHTATQKLWGITSWGDGALLSGDSGVYSLAAPHDPYWKGLADRFKPEPPKIDTLFTPNTARKDREGTFKRLLGAATADHTRISAKQRSQFSADKLAQAVDEGAEGAEAVYADWLNDSGDPRGELAQIQLRLAKDPKNKELKKAEKALLEQHAEAWLGKLASVSDVISLEWTAGFISKARLANTYARDPEFGPQDGEEAKPPASIEKVLGWLLESPSGRFLRDLTVGIVRFDGNDYGGVAKELGKHYLPALRSLYLGDFHSEETELNWSSLGKLEPMYAALPNLETLKLRSGSMNLGTIVLPHLKTFEVVTGGMDAKSLKSIASAVWPSIETLSIQCGPEPEGSVPKPADFAPILDGETLPHLTRLGLDNLNFTHQLIEPVATSKILPQLSQLDLRMGTLGDDNIGKLFSWQKAFAHLEKLDVDDNYLGAEGKRLLKEAKLNFAFGGQREDEGDPSDRYASLHE